MNLNPIAWTNSALNSSHIAFAVSLASNPAFSNIVILTSSLALNWLSNSSKNAPVTPSLPICAVGFKVFASDLR